MIGTTIYLGTWQLSRYEWKKGVIADRITALGKEPIDITEEPLRSVPQPSSDQLQLVRLRGELDLGRGVTVSPRPPPKGTPEHLIPSTGNSGALVVAPLVRPDGSEVLVLRGWYPLKSLPAAGKQQIDIVGYLRAPEQVSDGLSVDCAEWSGAPVSTCSPGSRR
jgi:cytochrome oxidase assembly protein ShyY1